MSLIEKVYRQENIMISGDTAKALKVTRKEVIALALAV